MKKKITHEDFYECVMNTLENRGHKFEQTDTLEHYVITLVNEVMDFARVS